MIQRLALLFVVGCTATTVVAKTYEGDEAAALRCANTLAYTAAALNFAGAMGDAEKDVMFGVSARMLERHVSGTWPQKRRAMKIVRDRRDILTTLNDFRAIAAKCILRFPIN